MATMMPGDIEEFGTEGEKAFYKFLEGLAKSVGFVGCKAITSDWPVVCAAERAMGNDSYLFGKHYVSAARIFQSSASLRSAGTPRSTGSGLLTGGKAIER